MFELRYEVQTRLLLRCLPELEQHPCFALKGGTAINFFVRDLPRISVDIDLTYLPLAPRKETLATISEHLGALGSSLKQQIPGVRVEQRRNEGQVDRLTIVSRDATTKIEPNTILRGSVYPGETREMAASAVDRFGVAIRAQTLSVADLYGGKLCAALDRQHPRDLFDVKVLLEAEGITPEIRRAFVVYLAGHSRPMSELLAPRLMDIRETFEAHFVGMTRDEVALESLVAVQRDLPHKLVRELDDDERAFLLALKRREPDWGRLGLEGLDRLPALQWKLENLRRMPRDKHLVAVEKLARILEL
jgi:predicted nucleotidyltransferase component of viral defense system